MRRLSAQPDLLLVCFPSATSVKVIFWDLSHTEGQTCSLRVAASHLLYLQPQSNSLQDPFATGVGHQMQHGLPLRTALPPARCIVPFLCPQPHFGVQQPLHQAILLILTHHDGLGLIRDV